MRYIHEYDVCIASIQTIDYITKVEHIYTEVETL